MFKYIIIFFCLNSFLSLAQYSSSVDNSSISIKYSPLTYSNKIDYSNSSLKKGINNWGIYNYLGIGLYYYLEYNYDFAEINFINGSSVLNKSQTFIINKKKFVDTYTLYHWRVGSHLILSDGELNNDSKAFWLGMSVLVYPKVLSNIINWGYGVDFSASKQNNFIALDINENNNLNLNQITLYSNISYRYKESIYQAILTAYHTVPEDHNNIRQDFNSLEYALSRTHESWTVRVKFWHGRQQFILKKNGFIFINSNDLYKNGLGISLSYQVSPTKYISFNYNYARYINNLNDTVDSNLLGFSLSYTF